ncbi:outer membrane beta-barrel protein [uncultured Microbulbifer sp.]|uniref:outer membrane beta-barrel protein n=1 Tax=uncultured Microbulbifer sp. TaxID=348147 RepID=UPI00262E1959|nr:outer membrane beta-barrel protein [uncultured Microbulbifer sp.]
MKKIALSALIALASTSVYAGEQPFYLKASLGYVQFDSEDHFAVKKDLNSTGYAFTFGYRVNNYVAIEGSMANLGTIHRDYEFSIHTPEMYYDYDDIVIENYDYKSTSETKLKSYSLGLAFSTQVQQNLNAGFRLGVHQWCEETNGRSTYSGTRSRYSEARRLYEVEPSNGSYKWDSDKESGSNPYYGAEVNWSTGDWGITLEHTIYEIQDDKSNLSAVGVTYSF